MITQNLLRAYIFMEINNLAQQRSLFFLFGFLTSPGIDYLGKLIENLTKDICRLLKQMKRLFFNERGK